MTRCPSCGGVIGRDCFNPVECGSISNRNYEYEIQLLEYKVDVLTKILVENGLEIPDLEPKQSSQQDYFITDIPY